VNLYSFFVGLGASLGLLLVARRAPAQEQISWTGSGLVVLAAGLAGARLNFVLLHPGLFAGRWTEWLAFWQGGLTWPGGLVAAVLAIFFISLARRTPLGKTADRLYPLFIPLAALIWLGSAQAGVAYGQQMSDQIPWALPVVDEHAQLTYRWPLQYVAAGTLVLVAWWVEGLTNSARAPGARACLAALFFSLHTLLFSYWRADLVPLAGSLRLDYAVAIGLGVISLLGLVGMALVRLRASFSDEAPGANRESWFSPKE
jgi:phosphatidylglycerol:prolipoprotein diacylglycerol transferase